MLFYFTMKKLKKQTVVVLGASNKPQRYAYQALIKLKKYGHQIIAVHPKLETIDDFCVTHTLSEITETVDTLTLYIGPDRSKFLVDEIIALRPSRVIFNPGTQSKLLEKQLSKANIDYIHDCTLILLDEKQF